MNEKVTDSNEALRQLIRAGKDAAAREMARRIVARGVGDHYPFWILGSELMESADTLEEALTYLEKAHAIDSDSSLVLYDLAMTLWRLGRSEEARPFAERLLQQEPETRDVRHLLANIDSDLEKYDLAETNYQLLLKHDPNDAIVLNSYGQMLIETERYEEAEKIIKRGLRLNVFNPDLLQKLALCYRAYGSELMEDRSTLEKALQYFREALIIEPDEPEALYHLGVVLRRLERDEEAITPLKQVVALEPDAIDARIALAGAYTDVEKYELAETQFLPVLKDNPDNTTALNNYGRMLRLAERYEEAEAILQRGVRLEPGDINLRCNLAHTYYDLAKNEEASAEYRIVSQLSTNDPEPYVNAGDALMELNRWQEARQEYEHALMLDPYHIDAHYGLGNVFTHLEKFGRAEREFLFVLDRLPYDVSTLNNYGRMLRLTGRYDEAVDILMRGLAMEPEDIDLRANLVECYRNLSREEESSVEEETGPMDWITTGDIYAGLGRWEEALREYETALSIAPDNVELQSKIARVKAVLG